MREAGEEQGEHHPEGGHRSSQLRSLSSTHAASKGLFDEDLIDDEEVHEDYEEDRQEPGHSMAYYAYNSPVSVSYRKAKRVA